MADMLLEISSRHCRMGLFWKFKVFCGISIFISVFLFLNSLSNQTSRSRMKTRFVPHDFKLPRNGISFDEKKNVEVPLHTVAVIARKLHNPDEDIDLELNYKDFYKQDNNQLGGNVKDDDSTVYKLQDFIDESPRKQENIKTEKYKKAVQEEPKIVSSIQSTSKHIMFSDKKKLSYLNMKTSSVQTVLNSNGQILDCVTMRVLGEVPDHIETEEVAQSKLRAEEDSEMRKKSFVDVYNKKGWGHSFDDSIIGLNVSGKGSSLNWAQEMIAVLHTIIPAVKLALNKTKISILDIPCGDMQWMSRFLLTRDDIVYTGMDIVPDLISRHKDKYKKYPWKFIEGDILTTKLGRYDLILNRMMLQHLFFKDVQDALYRFSSSGGHFLLTTTFPRHDKNTELQFEDNPGRFREVNLEIPPFSLSPPLCIHNDGPSYDAGGRKHFMGLWKLPLSKVKKCTKLIESHISFYNMPFYSCSGW